MTAKNENMPFLVLISLISAVSVAVFALGALAQGGVLALGFVLIFTSLLGWASYVGFRSGSVVRPGSVFDRSKEEQPAEKASCATTLSA